MSSVTAMADKLGVEFALFHRQRVSRAQNAPEKMDLLVGDVKDKVVHCLYGLCWANAAN